MARYAYKALDESGRKQKGTLEAESLEGAERMLLERDLVPMEVKALTAAAGRGVGLGRFASVKAEELILFTKQFRTLLRAGVGILRILEVLEKQTENTKLRSVLAAMGRDIRDGAGLFEAFHNHPSVFSPLYCNMIRAGEQSGSLPQVLERLTYIIEHEHKVRSDIKSALQYPIIVSLFLVVAFFVLLTFVIPKFVSIFDKVGIDLPLPTKIALNLYAFLENFWVLLLFGLVGGILALVLWFRTPTGRLLRDRFLLALPLFGKLFAKAAMSRFASIFSILQASGIPVLDTLKILSGAIGNAAVAYEFDQIGEKLSEGKGIAGPLSEARYFTPMVVNMVAIGEESGNLEEMMQEVAVHYDDEVGYATKRLSDAVGPLLTVGLAVVVGFFAAAIFLPMWDLTQMVK
ncbi:type II secretion system F family protein [Desulfobotulus sp.]|jgi:type IV pilus assembly protein PilC|uniref:type II secretion system F family protein n=1 Tax=Desulfobotulus sp. TaxID=1940337 RepID=UPI002A3615D9|nr:type II secretion system F family protein [Desulfobotulus sp.]MDY0163061.1 type II secretion system F family protein [Desulfobotulus sp.]